MTLPRCLLVIASVLIAIYAIVRPAEAHCDKSKARLKIKWSNDTGIAPETDATDKSADAVAIERSEWAEQPMMVYIPSDDPKDAITAKLETAVFVDEKVAIGAKFFYAVRISTENSFDDRILTEYTRGAPHIIFLKRDYTVYATLQGRQISASKLLKVMKALVRAEYVNEFDKMVREYAKLLNELDRLEDQRAVIEKLRARFDADPNAARAKKLGHQEDAYDAAMDAWLEKEEKLLEFRLKAEKKKASS